MATETYPAYNDSPTASTWLYGLTQNKAGSGTYVGTTGTAAVWSAHTLPLNLSPGTYYLTELFAQVGFTSNADTSHNLDAARFAILEDNAGTLTPVTLGNGETFVDMTADVTWVAGGGAHLGPTTVANVSFTLEAGKSYQLAYAMRCPATRTSGRPGWERMDDTYGPQGLTSYTNLALADFPGTSYVGTANSSGECARCYIKFTTPVRKLLSTTYSSAKDVIVPRRTDGDYAIKFQKAVAADGQAFTALMGWDNSGVNATRTTLTLDMGATNQIGYGGVNLALQANEAGDAFDLLAEFRASGKSDLFMLNRSTGQGAVGTDDHVTFSHCIKGEGTPTRGHAYTIAGPDFIKLSGTASVQSLEVCWEYLVLFGDSQLCMAGLDNISSSSRLGQYLPTAFTHDRTWWCAFIAGSRLCATGTSTAGYLRYKHTTPGLGDLCEMSACLFVIGGYGINDIATVGTTESERNKIVGLMATRIAEILDDLQDRAIPVLVIGLPPYSKSPDASEQEAQCVKQWNICLEGLACGVRAAYYNPWSLMCSGGTAGTAISTLRSEYSDDAGLHYNSAGAALVSACAAGAFESGIVGGWLNNPGKRVARTRGFLMP